MEPGSAIRRKAATCREDALVAATSDGTEALVEAALRIARIEIEDRDFGDGGVTRALLTRGEDKRPKIRVSTRLDAPGRLVAIAHELGHHHLHEDPCLRDGHGLYRSGRAETLQGARVEGYSPRQLKEVQADLFADELLCPSAWLRTRLAEGPSPSEVAVELGLPLDLVRRQAANALLRSVAGEETPAWRFPEVTLDPEQEACVSSREGALLVVGGPGTGKTTTIATRVLSLLGDNVRPSSLLVLAATKIAAERLHAALAEKDARVAGEAWVSTFEDLAFEIVARWPEKVGSAESIKLIDRVAQRALLDRAVGGAQSVASEAKALLRCFDAARLETSHPVDRLRCEVPKTAAGRSVETYRAALAAEEVVDANGLVPLAIEILRLSYGVRRSLRIRFKHLLVDDIQDAPVAGVSLLREIFPPGEILLGTVHVFATGDPLQSIEAFRGRTPAAIGEFARVFGADQRRLTRNHRSVEQIAAVVSALGDDVAPCGRGAARSRAGRCVTFDTALDAVAEAEVVATRIVELRREGVAFADQAVLAWSHPTLKGVANALRRMDVPLNYLGDLKTRDEVRDVIAFLRFAVDLDAGSFPAVAALRQYAIPTTAVRAVQAEARRRRMPIQARLGRAGELAGVSRAAAARLHRLWSDSEAMRGVPLADGLSDWLFARDGYLAPLLRAGASAEDRMRLLALHHVVTVCEQHQDLGGRDADGLARRIAVAGSLDQRTRFSHLPTDASDLDAVVLSTIRGARGREFRVVHVAGLWSKPSKADVWPATDDAAVLRVAASRARERLHLTRPLRNGKAVVAGLPSLDRLTGILDVHQKL